MYRLKVFVDRKLNTTRLIIKIYMHIDLYSVYFFSSTLYCHCLYEKILHFGEKWEARGRWSWKQQGALSVVCIWISPVDVCSASKHYLMRFKCLTCIAASCCTFCRGPDSQISPEEGRS